MRPAFAKLVSRATPSRRSMTVTSLPAWARYQAVVTPMTPPPMTATLMSSPASPRHRLHVELLHGNFSRPPQCVLGHPRSLRSRSDGIDQRSDKGLPYSVDMNDGAASKEVFVVMRSSLGIGSWR